MFYWTVDLGHGMVLGGLDSVKLGLKGQSIALYVSLGIRLNLHKECWDELAWVHVYDWNTMQARPGGPRDMIFGVYFKLTV